jgi:hypothetical protein
MSSRFPKSNFTGSVGSYDSIIEGTVVAAGSYLDLTALEVTSDEITAVTAIAAIRTITSQNTLFFVIIIVLPIL